MKTREEKSSVSSVRAPRRPLHQPRRRVLLSLRARLCIRYLPMWYWCGARHGIACMRPSLAGWGSPENWQFSGLREGVLGLVRYVRPEYERTQAEICGFLACLSQRLRDAVLRIVLTLVHSLCAHLCIRYLPMWYWCGAWHGMLCMRPSLAGWGSPENRSSLAAYPRTQYVPPWDSVPHPENCTFSELPTSSLRAGPQAPTNTTFGR